MGDTTKTEKIEVVKESETNDEKKESLRLLSNFFKESAQSTAEVLKAKNLLENVAIFVDYDNVYWTLMKNFSHDPDHEDPEKNLFVQLWNRYGRDHVRTFRVYADFQKIRTSLTNLQKNRVQIRHVYSNGKDGDNRKNSSDIELCIDAIENTYKDKSITCYVFVTADSDMIPILSRMMYKGNRVELFYLSDAAPKHVDMKAYAHHCEDLKDFLKIEEKTYDIKTYIVPGLELISNWYDDFAETDRFLGASWLKGHLARELSIPEVIASELIEKLQTEDLIKDGKKECYGTPKASIMLTENGKKLLEEHDKYTNEAAVTK